TTERFAAKRVGIALRKIVDRFRVALAAHRRQLRHLEAATELGLVRIEVEALRVVGRFFGAAQPGPPLLARRIDAFGTILHQHTLRGRHPRLAPSRAVTSRTAASNRTRPPSASSSPVTRDGNPPPST